jgi:hypothetical protein
MNDKQMFFERVPGAEITVFVNGFEVQKSADGYQVSPLISAADLKYGAENVIAIKVKTPPAMQDAPMWGTAFLGSEPLYNTNVWTVDSPKLKVKRGASATFKVVFNNPYTQPVEGRAVLASPFETWTEAGSGSVISILPRWQAFKADAGAKVPVTFTVDVPAEADPGPHVAAVKFIFNGIPAYSAPVDIIVE